MPIRDPVPFWPWISTLELSNMFFLPFFFSGALKKMKAKFNAKPIAAAETGEAANEKKND
jgi:hypothetical protein